MKGEGAGGIDVKLEQASKHRHHQGGIATAWVTLSVSLHTAQRGWPVGGWVARQFLAARTVWQPACLPAAHNQQTLQLTTRLSQLMPRRDLFKQQNKYKSI